MLLISFKILSIDSTDMLQCSHILYVEEYHELGLPVLAETRVNLERPSVLILMIKSALVPEIAVCNTIGLELFLRESIVIFPIGGARF